MSDGGTRQEGRVGGRIITGPISYPSHSRTSRPNKNDSLPALLLWNEKWAADQHRDRLFAVSFVSFWTGVDTVQFEAVCTKWWYQCLSPSFVLQRDVLYCKWWGVIWLHAYCWTQRGTQRVSDVIGLKAGLIKKRTGTWQALIVCVPAHWG